MNFVKSQPGKDPIIVECYFPASPAKVYEAWTDAEIVKQWFGYEPNSLNSAKIDLRPGGAWQFLFIDNAEKSMGFEGEYIEIQENEKIVFSWAHITTLANGKQEKTSDSRVEVIFSAKGNGTDVRLIHSAISNDDARKGIGGGWESAFASLLDMI